MKRNLYNTWLHYRHSQGIKSFVGVFAFILVAGLSIGLVTQVFASDEKSDEGASQRVITVHDHGEEVGILTDAKTLREALEDNDIIVDKHDSVEPELDEELDGETYEVNIYRARPVTIIDGSDRYRIKTSHQTPKQIMADADLELHDEDEAKLSTSVDPFLDGSGEVLQVTRATSFKLDFFGKKTTAHTMAKTVGEYLDENDITLEKNEKSSLPRSAKIKEGMKLSLWRNGKQTITRTETVDFTVQKIEDKDKPASYHKVKTPGVKGKQKVTYDVIMRNGKEVKRKKVHSVTVKKPQKQVEIVGAKSELPSGSHEDWMRKAGISPGDFGYVNAIFEQESGWRPDAVSPDGRYHGLGQTNIGALSGACSSWKSDPICQIKFFDGYKNRYGSWKKAYEFKFGGPDGGGAGWW